MHFRLLQNNNSKNSRSNCDLIGNKIADRITKVSKNLQQNNSETVTNGHHKLIPKENICLQKKQ